MQFWHHKEAKKTTVHDNRINIIIAIIFLLGGGLIAKLFSLQVMDYGLYIAKADEQHKSFSILEPDRGKIFIQDDQKLDDSLYPLATEKEFALVYAVPKDIKDAQKMAEVFYQTFKQEKIEQEVDQLFKKEDDDNLKKELDAVKDLPENQRQAKEDEIMKTADGLKNDPQFQSERKAQRELEINIRKEAAIKDYLTALDKPNDPYEPIERKVDEDLLKKLYVLAAAPDQILNADDLKIKDGFIVTKGADGKEEEVKVDGLGFQTVNYRFYPEKNIGANLLGFVSYDGDEQRGEYGLEGFFNDELTGKAGSVRAERGAGGALVIVNDREYVKPVDGSDLVLTINRAIQFTACQKLDEAVSHYGADGGSVIIMDPNTGAILAMCSNPDFDPNDYREVPSMEAYNNETVFGAYEPGSIFKAITMAAALDQGKVTPETTYDDTGVVKIDKYEIKNSDHKGHGVVNMTFVLENSLNTGAIFAMRQIGPQMFGQYVKNFGFGEKTGIELEGESAGNIRNLTEDKYNEDLNAATASFGQGLAVTPLQMVTAFGAIANGGVLMRPYLVKDLIRADGTRISVQPKQIRRVISPRAAALLGGMLVDVVEKGHGKKAGVKGYYVGGKTGTAQVPGKDGRYQVGINIGSFAGFAPVDNPRFVMLVRMDHPRGVVWAESSAAPVFGDLAQFLLNYWQVPTERPIDDKK